MIIGIVNTARNLVDTAEPSCVRHLDRAPPTPTEKQNKTKRKEKEVVLWYVEEKPVWPKKFPSNILTHGGRWYKEILPSP